MPARDVSARLCPVALWGKESRVISPNCQGTAVGQKAALTRVCVCSHFGSSLFGRLSRSCPWSTHAMAAPSSRSPGTSASVEQEVEMDSDMVRSSDFASEPDMMYSPDSETILHTPRMETSSAEPSGPGHALTIRSTRL